MGHRLHAVDEKHRFQKQLSNQEDEPVISLLHACNHYAS